MRFSSAAFLSALLAYQAEAHGSVNFVTVGGQKLKGYEPSNKPGTQPKAATSVVWASNDYNIGFVLPTDYQNANIICHKNASPAPKAATVAAGDTISLSWPNWPKTDPHPGVFLNYLAPAGTDDPTKIDKNQLKFFKISQSGYAPDISVKGPDKGLATGDFKKDGLTAEVQIPANIKAGTYVLRHEIIALHEAEKINKAQNYPQCVTLKVTGGGSATPDGVLGTQLYKADEPGILVKNFYNSFDPKKYQLPGPPLWDGASSGTSTATDTSTRATTTDALPSTANVADESADVADGSADVADESASSEDVDDGADDEGGEDADEEEEEEEEEGEDEDEEEEETQGRKSGRKHGGYSGKNRGYRNRSFSQGKRRHPRDFSLA